MKPKTKENKPDVYIRALSAAPDSLIKSLTGKEYAKQTVDGAKEIAEYLFPTGDEKKPKK